MAKNKPETTSNDGGFAFNVYDLIDLAGLAARLQDTKDPLSQYLVGRFRPETLKALDDFDRLRRGIRRCRNGVAR